MSAGSNSRVIFIAVCLLAVVTTAHGATIAMNNSDAINTSSFNSGLHWTGGATPTNGNAYQTANFLLRTPAQGTPISFAGDSLEVQGSGELRIKTGSTVTVGNLILDDTSLLDLTAPTGGNAATLAGITTLIGTVTLRSGIQPNENANVLTISSIMGGTGGVSVAGDFGTIIFAATNTYSGATAVGSGIVQVNGAIGVGAVTVSGGTLAGRGLIKGAVATQAGGTIQPGLGGNDTSTLTISNSLTLAGNSLFMLNRANAQRAARISGVGGLSLGGTLTVNNAGPALQLGDSFVLFSASSFSGSFSSISLPALNSGLSWSNSVAQNGTITVVAGPLVGAGVWTNDASSVWSAATNWLGGVIADGVGSNADFSTINLTTDRTVTLDTSRNLGSLVFGDTSGTQNWFMNSSGGSVLTLAVSSGVPTITVNNNIAALGLPIAGTAGLNKAGPGTLSLSGLNTYSGPITVSAGTMNLSSVGGGGTAAAATLTVGTAANTPAVLGIMIGANVTNYSLAIGGNATGPGAVYQSGGALTQVLGANIADFRIGGAAGAYGYYLLSGGTLTVNEVGVGSDLAGSIGVMDITGGNYVSSGYVTLARGVGSLGALNVAGGTMTLSGIAANSVIGLLWNGSGSSAGIMNIYNGGYVSGPANTTYILNYNPFSGGGASQSGIVNLGSGGTLQIGGVNNSLPAAGLTLLNFNGGTLKATVANANYFPNSISGAFVYGGGAILDDNGAAITISEPLLAPSGYGAASIPLTSGGSGYIGSPFVSISGGSGSGATAIAQVDFSTGGPTSGQVTNLLVMSPGSGYGPGDVLSASLLGGGPVSAATTGIPILTANVSGGLTKQGTGVITLTSANTYAGSTVVSSGTLLVNGSLGSGPVRISGGTLGGSGVISGSTTNQAGGTLQAGLGGADTSTLSISNNVTLAGTTVFTLNRTNAQNSSRIAGITRLAQGGTLTVVNAGPPLQAGDSFTLFAAASYTNSFSVTNLPVLTGGLTWNNTIAQNGAISVNSTSPPGVAVVANLPATTVLATSATLNGQVLSTGGQIPSITVYFGMNDGGTTPTAWSNSISLGLKSGTYSTLASGLATNKTYYFTASASNSAGIGWASPSQSFTTLAANPAATLVSMLTYHNDNTRVGANTNETLLTLANVNSNTFGKLFSYAVDGYVYTQPLIMTNLTIPGKGVHDVVFVATEHDTVYAFDANSNTGTNGGVLWQLNLGVSALSSSGAFGYRYTGAGYPDIVPEVGATGTPVIDPVTGTIYVDAFTRDVVGGVTNYVHRIHALDVTTGNERSYGPVVVAATYPGTGFGSSGGVMTFSAVQHNQRGALTLAGGILYVAYAGYADTDPYHGWLMGYNATNLTLLTNYVFNTTPNATTAVFGSHAAEGGFWMGGNGFCVDSNNNLYAETGNGSFSAWTNGGDYADSFIKLSTTNGLSLVDYFTPHDQATLAANDTDLGSCGSVLLPDSVGSATHPHLIAGTGKSGTIYLLDRDNLGRYNTNNNDNQIVQSVAGQLAGDWSSPVYFNKLIFCQPSSSVMRSFTIDNGALGTTPASSTSVSVGAYNGGPVISANGTNNAIAWVLNNAAFGSSGPDVLYAFNATNLSQQLYNSSQNLARDNPGGAVKLTCPTVAGGKVYVGAQYALSVYGVQVFLDTPMITPTGGLFTNSINVTISDASPGASIYYTLDGTTPTASSALYSGSFALTSNALVQAIAIQPGAVSSGIASASFVNSAAPGNGTGLLGQYFANTFATNPFVGSPLVRTDATVNFNWSAVAPDPSIGLSNYTVRWTGSVQPQYTEAYTFYTSADDGVRLYVNGQLLIDNWNDQAGAVTRSNTIALVAQQLYSIRLEYYQRTGTAVAALLWSSPSTPQAVIPQRQLYPVANQPPTVVLIAPASNSTYTASASVTIGANAMGPYNPISKVDFYANAVFVGRASNLPYAVTATGLGAGSYVLSAVATDGSGLSSTSAPVNINVLSGSGQPYGLTSRPAAPAFYNMPTTFNGSVPLLLSQTGVFSNTPSLTPAAGFIPYNPNTPLWSDSALKTRYLAVPYNGGAITPDQQITFATNGEWSFPSGTVFVKHFDLNTDLSNPNVKRRLETRLLVRDINAQVYGVTYKWRSDNSDADLLTASLTENILITNASGVSTQVWYYPSPGDCLTCHTPVANYVLGVKTRQVNGSQVYPDTGVTDNQIRTLNRLGMLNPAPDEATIPNYSKLFALTNLSASLEDRSRSYFDANCAQCHRPGGVNAAFDARWDTPLAQQNITNDIVVPRDIWRSELYGRMNTTDPAYKMPPLARNLIDSNAVSVVRDWINSLPGIPALAPPTITPNGGVFYAPVKVTLQSPDTNALIYYTLDGTPPTPASPLYTGPITITNNAMLSASAFESGYTNSITSSAVFLIQPIQFTSAGFTSSNTFLLGFAGAPGSNYVLQATTNFAVWTPLSTNVAGTNLFYFVDPRASNFQYRFYRVLQQ